MVIFILVQLTNTRDLGQFTNWDILVHYNNRKYTVYIDISQHKQQCTRGRIFTLYQNLSMYYIAIFSASKMKKNQLILFNIFQTLIQNLCLNKVFYNTADFDCIFV